MKEKLEQLRGDLREEVKRLREIWKRVEELTTEADDQGKSSTVSLLNEVYDDLDTAINNIEEALGYLEELQRKSELAKLVGKRVLIESYKGDLYEARILEVSSDGEFIKIEHEDGRVEWKETYEITVKSVLED